MNKIVLLLSLTLLIISCKSEPKKESESLIEASPDTQDWIYLFDGISTKGWRAFNGDELPPGWTVKDSMLTFDTELGLEQDYKGGIDIIYGLEEFDNFELYLEWKIPKGGNSGIYYHLKEGLEDPGPTGLSPEYQIIDDENYTDIHDIIEYNLSVGFTNNPSQLDPMQQTGSDYAMYAADPEQKVLYPVGEWNSSKIIFTLENVEYWLNGKKLLSFVPYSEDWHNRRNARKWKDFPNYGKFKTGYIGLQDHSSPIWFKNIKIRKL